MLCLLASNNLYIQLQMLDLKKIKLSKYQYEVKQNCSSCFGFNFQCLYFLNKNTYTKKTPSLTRSINF